MKKIIYLLGLLFFISCTEDEYTSTGEIVTFTISYKETYSYRGIDQYSMYFQTPTETFDLYVSENTYNTYNVGDNCTGLIINKVKVTESKD
jgi:hypothetical protein